MKHNNNSKSWTCPNCANLNFGDTCDICQFPRPANKKQHFQLSTSVIVACIASIIAIIAIIIAVVSLTTDSEVVTVYTTPEPTPESTPEPVVQKSIITTEIPRSARDYHHYLSQTKIKYNVFTTGEVKDCFAAHIDYSCRLTDPSSGKSVSGTRIVYARDYANEISNNDNAWTAIGSFYYDSNIGEEISVDLNWDNTLGPINIYSMVIIRTDEDANTSYSASWGDVVTLYSYTYS